MTTGSTPLISIVLPTYNVEKYVERCILSLQAQDETNFEIVFVDDCGQDNSIKIIEQHAKLDPRIRIASYADNKGTFAARHHGAKVATGRYIFFVDPDDEIAPNAISTLNSVIVSENPDMITTGVRIISRNHKWYRSKMKWTIPRSANYPNIMKHAFLDINPCWGTPGKVYRRELLLNSLSDFEHVHEPLLYGEDVLVYLLVANRAKKMIGIPSEIYWHHYNDTSITQKTSRTMFIQRIYQRGRIMEILDSKISSDVFSDPHAKEAAINVLRLFSMNSRSFYLELLQDVNSKFLLGIFAHGNWKWTLRLLVFFATLGKFGFRKLK